MWSRKSAMLGSLAVAMYLLGLTLRNTQLVTIAVVIFVFLTWAALLGEPCDVASSGRRADEWSGEEGVALGSVVAMRKLSSARMFEDGELSVTLRMQNTSSLPKILEVRDRVPEVMRIKEGANYILMELGPRRETFIEYTVECPLRGFTASASDRPHSGRLRFVPQGERIACLQRFPCVPEDGGPQRDLRQVPCAQDLHRCSEHSSTRVPVPSFTRCVSTLRAILSVPSTGQPTLGQGN
jgi:hypothetical protein